MICPYYISNMNLRKCDFIYFFQYRPLRGSESVASSKPNGALIKS